MKRTHRLILEYIIIAVTPVIIFSQSDFDNYNLPYIFLLIWVVVAILLAWKEGFSLKQIGISKENLRMGNGWYFLIALFCLIFIFAAATILEKPIEQSPFDHWHFKLMFIPVSFFQELIYRGIMLSILRVLTKNKFVAIPINTLAFVALHMFFPDFHVTFFMPLFFGFVMDLIYWEKPNLVAASVTHSVVNFAVVSVSWV